MIFSKNYVNPFLIKYVNDKFMNIWIMNLWKYASFSKDIESDHEKHLKELINIIVKFFITYFYDHDCERYLSHMNSHWWIIFFYLCWIIFKEVLYVLILNNVPRCWSFHFPCYIGMPWTLGLRLSTERDLWWRHK